MCFPPAEDVHLAPGFSSSYDTPPFYPGDQASSGRLYSGDRYSDQVFKTTLGDLIGRDSDGLTDLCFLPGAVPRGAWLPRHLLHLPLH